jgi:hypothetical protein
MLYNANTFDQNSLNITLNIANNTNQPQEINVMGSPVNLLDTGNATRQFLWDITNENIQSFLTIDLSIEYKTNNELSYSTYSFTYYNDTIGNIDGTLQALVTQLNNLSIGYFTGYVQNNQVFITTYNDNYEFNIITINGTSFAGELIVNNLFLQGVPPIVGQIVKDSNSGNVWLAGSMSSLNFIDPPIITVYNAGNFCLFESSLFTNFDGATSSILTLDDESIIVVGVFSTFNDYFPPFSIPAPGIIKLKKELGIVEWVYDNTFNPGSGIAGSAAKIIKDSNGKYIIVGAFNSYDGNVSPNIVRINPDGSYDASFFVGTGLSGGLGPQAFDVVEVDNKYIVVGAFNDFNGNAVSNIVRIDSIGNYDATLFGQFNDTVRSIKYFDNKLICGGRFSLYDDGSGNFTAQGILRILLNGNYDNTFDSSIGINLGAAIYSLEIQSNGKIIVGGDFSTYGGNLVGSIARVNTDGTFDTTFNTGTGFTNGLVGVLSLLVDSNILWVGGTMTDYNGSPISAIAKIYLQSPA